MADPFRRRLDFRRHSSRNSYTPKLSDEFRSYRCNEITEGISCAAETQVFTDLARNLDAGCAGWLADRFSILRGRGGRRHGIERQRELFREFLHFAEFQLDRKSRRLNSSNE